MTQGVRVITREVCEKIAKLLDTDQFITVDYASRQVGVSYVAVKGARYRVRHGKATEEDEQNIGLIEDAVERQCKKLLLKADEHAEAGKRTSFQEWVLENKAPHLYGRKQRQEITGEDGGPVKTEGSVSFSQLPDDVLLETYLKARKDAAEGQ